MVTQVDCAGAGGHEYCGLSTDQKPLDGVAMNALFLELDTGDFYYYTGTEGTEWSKVGGSA